VLTRVTPRDPCSSEWRVDSLEARISRSRSNPFVCRRGGHIEVPAPHGRALECEDDWYPTPHNGRRPAARTAMSRYACIFCLVMTVWLVPAPAKARHRTMTMRATAYTGHGRTASGKRVRRGMIAADQRVLPRGTKVRLKNAGQYSGVYRVEDTGGKIRGRKIDIYMPSRRAAKQFGRQKVKVEVLTPQKNRR